MTTTQLNLIAPLDTPLPALAPGEVLTETQWTTLMAIADTIIPSIEVSSMTSRQSLCVQTSDYAIAVEDIKRGVGPENKAEIAQNYMRENASSLPSFRELLKRSLAEYVREDAKKGIRVILSALK